MRGRKRRSEYQLTRAGESQCQDLQSDLTMTTIYEVGSTLWNWCISFIFSGISTATSDPVIPVATTANSKESKPTPKTSYEIPHKRPKIFYDANLSKSKSMVDFRSKEVSETLDVSKCDVNEARRKIENFWEPKPLPWVEQSLIAEQQSSTITAIPDSERLLKNQPFTRRSSDPPKLARTPNTHLRRLTLVSKFKFDTKSLEDSCENSIQTSIENLLVGSTKQLAISDFKRAKNLLRAKELKEKERQNAINKLKQRRLLRIYPRQKLVQFLDPYWEDRVCRAHTTWGEDTLSTSIGGTELRIKDFKTLLDHRAWLNDEIINSYIEWVVDAANRNAREELSKFDIEPNSVPPFIAHNSFFYETLRKRGPKSLDRLMKRKGAPGVSLLEVDSVFVPICNGSHWTLGVVRPVAKTIEYFDSMGGNPSNFIHYMEIWLKHQLGEAYSYDEWTIPRTACANQTNGYDCGVFVCTNAFCVAVGLDTLCYQESDMTRQRKSIAAILLNRGFNGDFAWQVRENGLSY
ncbi:Ubiquitin-like-specific protease 1 [Erysiphe necator]|uniref:Putative ulp1 protease family protein n=1 Tax=Uncinula necator TaxID=52586 RepID=A0A0B1P9V3_UNCNE|nr:Ubiquitin-like-specific protease 1 [Erysiphe necator]KHJ33721.1 putative ulp1 protease family protein [Erysiphe necator]